MSIFYGCAFIVLLGLLFGLSFSRQTFKEAVPLQDVPTPAEYLMRRGPFVLGQIVFASFCLSVYAFVLAFYQQLPQLAEFLPSGAKEALDTYIKAITAKDSSLLVTVVAITTGFLYVVKTSFPGNLVFAFRSLVYSTIAVPAACKHATEQLLENLNVPQANRVALAADAKLHIANSDFDKPIEHVGRQWADLAYMNSWVQEQKEDNPGPYVFLEKSFHYHKLQNQFVALRELTRLSQSAEDDDAEAYAAMSEILKELRSHYARYMSCILITLSNDRLDFYRRCRDVGIDPGTIDVSNPLSYSALYIITLAATVAVGPYIMAVCYDLVRGAGRSAFTSQNLGYVWNWLITGFAVYFSPIFTILLIRYIAWWISPTRTWVSLVIYSWILLGVFLISLVGGIIASMALRHGDFTSLDQIIEAARRSAPWSIAPALTSLYINYYLDLQADPAKDDIVQTRDTIVPRLLSAAAFTFSIVLLSMLIVAYQHFSERIWSRTETQVIVVGTTALITFSLCLVAQFGLRKMPTASGSL